jgi:hypothetical protein
LQRKQVDWGFFLFWNEFQTKKPPEAETKKTSGRKTITPKSSQRKRRAISPLPQQDESSSSKRKRSKRKLDFDKAEDVPMEGNPLNLPYSESEPETEHKDEQGEQQTDTVTDEYPNLPTPTPPEEQNRSPAQEQTGLENLVNLATTMVDTPEPSTQPVEVRRSARTRAASSKKP